jgi:hypothetical protein
VYFKLTQYPESFFWGANARGESFAAPLGRESGGSHRICPRGPPRTCPISEDQLQSEVNQLRPSKTTTKQKWPIPRSLVFPAEQAFFSFMNGIERPAPSLER